MYLGYIGVVSVIHCITYLFTVASIWLGCELRWWCATTARVGGSPWGVGACPTCLSVNALFHVIVMNPNMNISYLESEYQISR